MTLQMLHPYMDRTLAYITDCRHFCFRIQSENEKALYDTEGSDTDFHRFDNKAAMFAKEYMSSPDSATKPNEEDRARYGPIVLLRRGPVEGTPPREPFRDMTRPTRSKDGQLNPLPRDFVGKHRVRFSSS